MTEANYQFTLDCICLDVLTELHKNDSSTTEWHIIEIISFYAHKD